MTADVEIHTVLLEQTGKDLLDFSEWAMAANDDKTKTHDKLISINRRMFQNVISLSVTR